MRKARLTVIAVLVSSIIWLLSATAWSAQLEVQEATLYVGAPAEVKAVLVIGDGSTTFDLPKQVVPESVQVTQADAPLSATLDPIYVPGAESSRPELASYRCQLTGLQPGAQVEVRFRTGGLSWKPGSTLTVDGARAKIVSQASITNQALGLTGARLRLMSGFLGGREGFPSMESPADYEAFALAMSERFGTPSSAEAGGLHLLAEMTSIEMAVGSTRQIPLVSGEIPVTCRYQWDTQSDSDYGGYHPPQTVAGVYTLENTAGKPLPEGKVTVSEGGTLVGSGYMSWTPPGGKGIVIISAVQGLTVRRDEQSKPAPKTWENRRTINLRVENSRDEKVTISITERLTGRWGSYEFEGQWKQPAYEFTQPPSEGTPGAFQWDLAVPAHGQAAVTYSFGEPIDLGPLRILGFTADDSLNERAYLVEAPHTSVRLNSRSNPLREIQPEGYILYRFPIPSGTVKAELAVWMGNAFRLSLAPEVNGKPGNYTVVADGIAIAGRTVRDGTSNYAEYRFDLSAYLSETSRAVYLRLEDPTLTNTKGGAFVRMVTVLRIPEGFSSRAPGYPTGDTAAAGKSASRKLLASFEVFTEEEKPFIYQDTKTWLQERVWPDRVRVADADQRIVYVFTIPPDVAAADCTIRVGNQFVIALARDEGGKPGEFREEINSVSLLGQKFFLGQNYRDWSFDLTPFLRDNAARKVYVALYDADPTDGWGAAIARVEVAALDDAQRVRLVQQRRSQEEFVRSLRGTFLVPGGSTEEASLLYDEGGSRLLGLSRIVDSSSYVIYHLPATSEDAGLSWFVNVQGDFLISLAPENKGKPGEFVPVTRARDLDQQEGTNFRAKRTRKVIDITERMIANGGCYVKITGDEPSQGSSVSILEVGKMPRT